MKLVDICLLAETLLEENKILRETLVKLMEERR